MIADEDARATAGNSANNRTYRTYRTYKESAEAEAAAREAGETDPAAPEGSAAASGAGSEGVTRNAVDTARAVTILELRADEVIEVARAARHIRKLHELRDHTVEVQETQLHTQTAIRRLGDLCCDPRLIVALMLYSADHPDWAWVNFWAAFCPDITVRQMAGLRKIPVSTVRTHLANVTLPDDAYNFIPDDR